jgi:hypothetical protein
VVILGANGEGERPFAIDMGSRRKEISRKAREAQESKGLNYTSLSVVRNWPFKNDQSDVFRCAPHTLWRNL